MYHFFLYDTGLVRLVNYNKTDSIKYVIVRTMPSIANRSKYLIYPSNSMLDNKML